MQDFIRLAVIVRFKADCAGGVCFGSRLRLHVRHYLILANKKRLH